MKKLRRIFCFIAAVNLFAAGCDYIKKYTGEKEEEEAAAYKEPSDFSVSLGSEADVKLAKEFLRTNAILAKNTSVGNIKTNLVLPEVGLHNVTIAWESDAPEVVSTTGKVTRPELGEDDLAVRLTASFTKEDVTDSKSFVVTVRAYTLDELHFSFVAQNSANSGSLPSNTIRSMVVNGSAMHVGTSNGLAISTDSGTTWTTKSRKDGLPSDVISLLAVSGNVIVAGENQTARVAISTDGGTTWRSILSSVINGYVYGVAATGSKVFLITSTYVYKSTDNGVTWTQLTAPGVTSLMALHTDGTNLYVGGYDGLSISANDGSSWATKTTTQGLPSNVIYTITTSGTNLYAGTSSGLAISSDGGTSFSAKTTSNGLHQNYVYYLGASGSNVIATGYDGYLSVSTDGATSFSSYTSISKSLGYYTYALAATSSGFYVGSSAGLGVSTNGTSYTLNASTSEFANTLTNLALDDDNLYVAATTKAYKVPLTTQAPSELTAFSTYARSVTTDGTTLYFGGSGKLYKSTDAGATATAVTAFPTDTAYDLKLVDGTLYAAGTSGVYLSTDSGQTFTTKTTTNGLASNWNQRIAVDGSNIIIASYSGSGASISIDGGTTFSAKTASSGLPSLYVYGLAIFGDKFIAATANGIAEFATSSASAASTTVYSTERGLQYPVANNVFAAKGSLWVCTPYGLSVSVDDGATFFNFDTRHGLPAADCDEIIVRGKDVFISTARGLAVATW